MKAYKQKNRGLWTWVERKHPVAFGRKLQDRFYTGAELRLSHAPGEGKMRGQRIALS